MSPSPNRARDSRDSQRERSPRIVPGAASLEFVVPIKRPNDLPRLFGSFDHGDERRSCGDERHQLLVVVLANVLLVVTSGRLRRRSFAVPPPRVAAVSLRDGQRSRRRGPALDAVGLHDEKGSIHDGEIYQSFVEMPRAHPHHFPADFSDEVKTARDDDQVLIGRTFSRVRQRRPIQLGCS